MRDMPARVADRPCPDQWGEFELMTLMEAACLFWPHGPLSCTSLRTAVRDGKLEVAEIAGKLLTCKDSIKKMSRCDHRMPKSKVADSSDAPEYAPSTVAEFRRMMAAKDIKDSNNRRRSTS